MYGVLREEEEDGEVEFCGETIPGHGGGGDDGRRVEEVFV